MNNHDLKPSPSTVLYLHGLSGNPRGTKWQALATQCGADNVIAPYLRFEENALSVSDTEDWRLEARRLFRAFADAVDIAQRDFDEFRPDVVVGSSFGGGVALAMSTGDVPLVLIAPCWNLATLQQLSRLYLADRFPSVAHLSPEAVDEVVIPLLPRIDPAVSPATRVLHSPDDELIPIDDSRELVRRCNLAPESLIEVGTNHKMSDDAALRTLQKAVQRQVEARQN